MQQQEFIFLSQDDVINAGGLDIATAFNAVEKGFELHGKKKYVQPSKLNLRKGPPGSSQAEQGLIMAMPSYIAGDLDVIGIKWVLAMADNPKKYGLPRSSALIILNHSETGLPLVIMDGTIVNAVRTGAVTGVGAKYLARKDAEVMCLIGAGPQGRMQIRGVAHALPGLKEVRIFDLDNTRSEKLAEEMNEELNVQCIVAESAEAAVRGSDVIVTATITTKPYLQAEWIKPGAFYGDIAAYDATIDVYKSANKIFVDDWEQIKHHGVGTLVNAMKSGEVSEKIVAGELGEVVANVKRGRENAAEFNILKHIGMSVTDLPVAYTIYKKAVEMGLGIKLALWKDKPVW